MKNCVICTKDTPGTDSQLEAYFFSCVLFPVDGDSSQPFLRYEGQPSGWIFFCNQCRLSVRGIRKKFYEQFEFERKITLYEMRVRLATDVFKTYNETSDAEDDLYHAIRKHIIISLSKTFTRNLGSIEEQEATQSPSEAVSDPVTGQGPSAGAGRQAKGTPTITIDD